MKRRLGLYSAIILLLFIPISSFSTTINVPVDQSTIQDGINASVNGDTVLVSSGTYYESINFSGKQIVVKSSDGALNTIITNDSETNLVTFDNNEDETAIIEGFTLEGGSIAIYCLNACPTIKYNLLINQNVGSRAAISLGTTGMSSYSAPAVIQNNTIVNCANGGISSFSTESPVIRNNIIAFNTGYGIHDAGLSGQVLLYYNNVYSNNENYNGLYFDTTGALSKNPHFENDFMLSIKSPCINVGDPNSMYNDSDGTRNDLGFHPYLFNLPIADGINFGVTTNDFIVYTLNPEINWGYFDTALTTQIQYHIQVGTDDEWSNPEIWDSGPVNSSLESIIYSGPSLDANSRYYLRLRVSNGIIWGDWMYKWFYVYVGHVISIPDDFQTIQEGIDIIHPNDTVLVKPGTYIGNIDFLGKTIGLISEGGSDVTFLQPEDRNVPFIIMAFWGYPTIQGFTIEDGGYNGALIISSDANVYNNVFRNNNKAIQVNDGFANIQRNLFYNNGNRGTIVLNDGARIVNNTFDSNETGIGINSYLFGVVHIRNNILTNNWSTIYGNLIQGSIYIDYNNIWNYWASTETFGDNDASYDPQYTDNENYDYGLKQSSPCIDAGDPHPQYNDPDGSRNDMGAFPRLFDMPYAKQISYDDTLPNNLVTSLTPIIYWTYYDVEQTTQVQYHLQISTDDEWSMAEMWDSGPVISVISESIYSGPPLDDNTKYFLRIRLNDGNNWGEWIYDWFTTHTIPQTIRVPGEVATIQEGIEAAIFADTVLVAEGIYFANLDFLGKTIVVTSEKGATKTFIRPSDVSRPTVRIDKGERVGTVFSGFTIRNGEDLTSTVLIGYESEPIIEHNIFRDNISELINPLTVIKVESHATIRYNLFFDNGGICAIWSTNNAEIINNTIDSNERGVYSTNSLTVLRNNIISNNAEYGTLGSFGEFDYNNVWNNGSGNDIGPNGISSDPLFVDLTWHNYNIRLASPCVDAGDPDPIYNDLNGTRNDIGAFPFYYCGDADFNNEVSVGDIVYLVNYYFAGGPPPVMLFNTDVNCDDIVSLVDIILMNRHVLSNGSVNCCY
ncbi:MAG: hypothetical protein GY865_16825 [candidate division Zixibacteria bacterium]|nr:hypothetical protein [candidate division Zixibacteria bacterium]